jgi:hypothetical protein
VFAQIRQNFEIRINELFMGQQLQKPDLSPARRSPTQGHVDQLISHHEAHSRMELMDLCQSLLQLRHVFLRVVSYSQVPYTAYRNAGVPLAPSDIFR